MKRILFFLLIITLFLLISCLNKQPEGLYSASEYQEAIELSTDILKDNIDKDALYYRMMSYYKLKDYPKTCIDAELYIVLYNSDKDEKLHDTLRLSLYYSDAERAVVAGSFIESKFAMSKAETFAYFNALMLIEDYDKANAVYNNVRSSLSGKEATMLLSSAKASSVLILSNLELWYAEEGYSEELLNTVLGITNLFITRGEGELLLPILHQIEPECTNSRIFLSIGDIYAASNSIQKARIYYSMAEEDFPTLTKIKLQTLR